MGENKPNRLTPQQKRNQRRPSLVQTVTDIIREKGIALVPDTAGRVFIRPGIIRVWATMFGWNRDGLRRVRVNDDGRVLVTDGVSPNSAYDEDEGNLVAPGGTYDFVFPHVCSRVQIYCANNILDVKLGVTEHVYYTRVIATPFCYGAAIADSGSILTFNGPVKHGVIGAIGAVTNGTVTIIGSYEK